jgi:aminomethyltransferase
MIHEGVLQPFSNVGYASMARSFPGFPSKSSALRQFLAPRDARRVELSEGDLISIHGLEPDEHLPLLVFDERGYLTPQKLGLSPGSTVRSENVECAELNGWLARHGGSVLTEYDAAVVTGGNDADGLVLRADAACHVWVLRPLEAQDLVAGATQSLIEVVHKPASSDATAFLPPPLGDLRDEFTVRRGTASAYELAAGEVVQIIDVEGQQCSDFMAFRAEGLERGAEVMIDSTATRTMVRRAYPGPGLLDKFFDREMRPLLSVVQDTCGQHDTFGLACTARGYEERGFPGHLNCSDNISDATAPFGVQRRAAWPAINFFWRTWLDPHSHQIMTEESHSRPGDYVAMRALDDLVCVSTACPDDIDPINGWNPTDIHVRIYQSDSPIRRAVAYREKEDAPMSISHESAFHERTLALTTMFAPARDLWAPVSYPSYGTIEEYWACRERVTLQDMSSLRKYDIVGPDVEKLLQHALTRDISRLASHRGTYALMCDAAGTVIDDGTLFRLGPDLFRWCCGSEESGRVLQDMTNADGLQVRIMALGGSLPNLALQGPKSRDLLRKIVFTQPTVPALEHLKWFGVTTARLNDREGVPFMLSRSGYTGELGYELFCSRADAIPLWDAIMEAGQEFGILPMGSAALETIRIEAGLAGANAEFAPGVDAFEAGLGFAVDLKKTDFVGKAALERNARDPRRMLKGLLLDCNDTPVHGAPVFDGERQVGVVTSATRSPTLECAIAMARLGVEHADVGRTLEVGQMDGRIKRLSARVADIPFIDPQRMRARA